MLSDFRHSMQIFFFFAKCGNNNKNRREKKWLPLKNINKVKMRPSALQMLSKK